MIWYAFASLLPYALAVFGALGTPWAVYFCAFYMALGVAGIDVLVPNRPDDRDKAASGLVLSWSLGAAHLVTLGIGVAALAGLTGLDSGAKIALFAALSLIFGQISNSNAHELIHNAARGPRWMGKTVYATILFGHHASAHPAIHHRYVATAMDPNSPAPGQSVYGFIRQAWTGSFQRGLEAEIARLSHRGRSAWSLRNPYWGYFALSFGSLAISFSLAGTRGVAFHIGLASFATIQLLTSDYVQHYGLRRRQLDDGRYEPVGPEHSWNAPTSLSRLMMLNAPLHSEHHMRPTTAFPALNRSDAPQGPTLPYSLPAMAMIAFLPGLWRRVMRRALGQLPPARPLPGLSGAVGPDGEPLQHPARAPESLAAQ